MFFNPDWKTNFFYLQSFRGKNLFKFTLNSNIISIVIYLFDSYYIFDFLAKSCIVALATTKGH